MSDAPILVIAEGAVTKIVLNRPDRLNALSLEMLNALHQALVEAGQNPACRCVLLTGAGRGFSAGADLKEERGGPTDSGDDLRQYYLPVARAIREMDKPVIAAVNGPAAGAGCSLALLCDIVIAARSAYFMLAFVNIGLVPDMGASWLIPRLIGRARTLQWMMSGGKVDAETAERWGLINAVHDDGELPTVAAALADQYASRPTKTLAQIKHLVDDATQLDFYQAFEAECVAQSRANKSADAAEGVRAFIERRKAEFTGQ